MDTNNSSQVIDEDSSILLLDDHEGTDKNAGNIRNDEDDEMLLLSSSSESDEGSSSKRKIIPKAGPSGAKKLKPDDEKASNIIIEDSDSEELENSESENSGIEVIGSEEEEDGEMEDSDSCESISSLLDGKVRIFLSQGSFFIWDVEDVPMLREECRIVGKLVGCLPRAPRQNNQLGLPLQLMPEEAKLLEEIEAAVVVEEVEASDDMEEKRKIAFENVKKENYKAQQIMYKESRKEEVLQHKHEIIEGKKAKKRKIQLEGSKGKGEVTPSDKHLLTSKVKQSEECDKANSSDCQTNESKETDTNADESVTNTSKTNFDCKNEMETIGECSANERKESLQKVKRQESENTTEDNKYSVSKLEAEEQTSESFEGGEKTVDKEGRCEVVNIDDEKDTEKKDDVVKDDSCMVLSHDDDDKEEEEEIEFNVDDIVTSETHVKHSLVQLFTENPWIEMVKKPKHWIFPLSQKEYLRYEVFKDLWKKGYFLTSGSKFGGDFLVYPGDPARYHSHFIAVCIDKTIDISALDIISLGRLGSNVRKTVLLCAFNKEKKIKYTSLQWTGIT